MENKHSYVLLFCVAVLQLMPDTLHVMGRIAHVQVWDYMDKLRSSTTRVRGSYWGTGGSDC